jgi:hypothetical protein
MEAGGRVMDLVAADPRGGSRVLADVVVADPTRSTAVMVTAVVDVISSFQNLARLLETRQPGNIRFTDRPSLRLLPVVTAAEC